MAPSAPRTPVIAWTSPAPIAYGTSLDSRQLNASANVPGAFTYTPASGTVLAVGTHTLTATFIPRSPAAFTSVAAKVTLIVNPATPAIAWPTPAPINWETALSAAQLDATSPIVGTFTYTPAAGAVLAAGSQTLSVSFAPEDHTDYTSAAATVQLAVNRLTPDLHWPAPKPIFYGIGLSPAQLDATSSVPGTFTYSPAAGAELTAGVQRLTVTFTPDDSADYSTATKTVELNVVQAAPIITWPFPPAPFIHGMALGSAQLNATANVPGTIGYSPAAGTVPPLGSGTVTATFTPFDTTNYTTATATVPLTVTSVPPAGPAGVIQHVVVIMQENRTLDNLFNGFPGADTVQSGSNRGVIVPLQEVPLEQGSDPDHAHTSWWTDWDNGKLDGFDRPRANYPIPHLPYAYVPQSETVPIWTLARAYTLADRMFQSNTGPSFVAHQYMIAGQSQQTDENPDNEPLSGNWGCDNPPDSTVTLLGPNGTDMPGVYPCFDYQTLGDELDEKGASWRYYAPSVGHTGYQWSAYDAIRHIRFGPEWTTNVISPNTQVMTDVANGTLADVTWVVPDSPYSDHPSIVATDEGPSWVADIVNAIGQSPYWNSTAILISWDDWGGWYDHVVPPQVDNMGLGFRVPLIVVSPWSKHGYVSHQQHEFGSFLHFTEEAFNLPSLGTRDAVSDDLSDCFDWTQTPQAYVPVATKYPPTFFVKAKPSDVPPDDD